MKLPIQEISVSLAIDDLTPAMFNSHQAGATDIQKLLAKKTKDWHDKERTNRDRSNISIKFDKIIFSEPISHKNKIQDSLISHKVVSYINKFSKINYQKLSIDFNSYLSFDSKQKLSEFFARSLIASNPWQQLPSDKPVALSLQLRFPYEDGIFTIDIEKTNIYEKNQSFYVVWFVGKFCFVLKNDSNDSRIKQIEQKVKQYRTYASQFQKFVAHYFATELIPLKNNY